MVGMVTGRLMATGVRSAGPQMAAVRPGEPGRYTAASAAEGNAPALGSSDVRGETSQRLRH